MKAAVRAAASRGEVVRGSGVDEDEAGRAFRVRVGEGAHNRPAEAGGYQDDGLLWADFVEEPGEVGGDAPQRPPVGVVVAALATARS
jgi:hypothetical protein